jgi:hypothetical protein
MQRKLNKKNYLEIQYLKTKLWIKYCEVIIKEWKTW